MSGQAGAERPPPPAHLGGHAALHPRGRLERDPQVGLPRVRHQHSAAVRRQRQPGHQRHQLHVLERAELSWQAAVDAGRGGADLMHAGGGTPVIPDVILCGCECE